MAKAKSLLEPEYAEAYGAYKKTPGPATAASFLEAAMPAIRTAVKKHLGSDDPVALGAGRRAFLDAMPRYDPAKAGVGTFAFGQLQSLKRPAQRAARGVDVPDRVAQDRYRIEEARRSLGHELGREPTDAEVMDHAVVPPSRYARALGYSPAVSEGALDQAAGGVNLGGYGLRTPGLTAGDLALHLVYEGLPPRDQLVMQYAFGMHGRKPLGTNEIAAKLRVTPGAVSQRKARIQRMLDEVGGLAEGL